MPVVTFTSAIPGLTWPAIPKAEDTAIFAVAAQLAESQWWPSDSLRSVQLRQLERLLKHADKQVPYYRGTFKHLLGTGRLSWERWRRVPLLTRHDIQQGLAELRARQLPSDHGNQREVRTSGSTGSPITTLETGLTRTMFMAAHLRIYDWHETELDATVASVRVLYGRAVDDWAEHDESGWVYGVKTGPAHVIDVRAPLDYQMGWLVKHAPRYLLTLPSNLRALIELAQSSGTDLGFLKQIHTYGEIVEADLRRLCQAFFGFGIIDMYSANELGVLAIQTPSGDGYYCMDETHLIEVLDRHGDPCEPGAIGRVVVTPLHNFASPLIRYENGDYAEVGAPAGDGRGLTCLARIIGRSRNMAMRPNGDRFWPAYGGPSINKIAPIKQIQLVQKSLDLIEVRAVVEEPLSSEQEDALTGFLQEKLASPYTIQFSYVDAIERGSGGKYEEFICQVESPPTG